MAKSKPRILIYDLETSFNVVAAFQLKQDGWIPHTNILQERFIISVAYQWLDEKKIHAVSVLDDPKRFAMDPTDDRFVVEKLHELFLQADCIVAHNGSKFDDKYVLTRALYHGLSPLPPIANIDTCQVARSKFLFNSNSLDYLARFLKVGKKKETPSGLWLRALAGDRRAIKIMVDYNKTDTALLTKVFMKLRPYISSHLNSRLFNQNGCPKCGSKNVQRRGVHVALTRTYQRFACQSCGGWFRENKPQISTSARSI